jgi:hypothetical protein
MSNVKENTQSEQQSSFSVPASDDSFDGVIDWKIRRAEQRDKDVNEIRKTGIAKILNYEMVKFKWIQNSLSSLYF